MNSNGMELEQVVHTCWTSCPSGLPGEFGGLNPRSNSFRAFISVLVGSTLLSYLFTTATVQILGGHTAPKYGTKPLRYYVTRCFRDRRSAASIRHRNRAEIITALVCEQKPYPVWFSWGGGGVIQYSMNIALIEPYSSFKGLLLLAIPLLLRRTSRRGRWERG